ncbi:tetratricopeptide repeat protein [Sphingomonas sp. GCM10030256]|uniref:tetratricopeptide repeat protein n=1 Tax=Sphingomonas sp. GCM10030256 TaxID=3273427 RepID=UPI00360C0549
MAQITRTCSLAGLAAMLVAAPALARVAPPKSSDLSVFVGARAAELAGDAGRSSLLYASLAQADPDSTIVANRAIAQAIAAGNMELALGLLRRGPATSAIDSTLLLTADHLVRGRDKEALAVLDRDSGEGSLGFLRPFVAAWIAAERRSASALDHLGQVPRGSGIAPYLTQNHALILLRLKRIEEAEPVVRAALGSAAGRESWLRTAFADAYLRSGDRARALRLLGGRDIVLADAREQIERGQPTGAGIATAAEALSGLLVSLGIDLARGESRELPLAMAQIARHADPNNAQAAILIGLLLGESGRTDEALAAFRSIPRDAVFASSAQDAEIRALLRAERKAEALARAQLFASGNDVSADDFSRLGDVYSELARHAEAAAAFRRAVTLVEAGAPGGEPWALHLLEGGALEQADRWPEAKAALQRARHLAPDNPLVLNYLGYAKLERGEELDQAEAMIARASQLAPRDPSITDSLGWAQFKRGRVDEAIATLQRAAAADPGQAEIHEHLGDALYTAGRRFEARFAWAAALVTADDDVRSRIESKVRNGLAPATAAP